MRLCMQRFMEKSKDFKLTEESEKWKADPKRGEQYLEPRRAEIVAQLETAADAAFYALEEKLAADIDALRKSNGTPNGGLVLLVKPLNKFSEFSVHLLSRNIAHAGRISPPTRLLPGCTREEATVRTHIISIIA